MGLMTVLSGKKRTQHDEINRAIERIITEASTVKHVEQRKEERYSFSQPVTLEGENAPMRQVSAFSREVSRSGIGLLHFEQIMPGRYVATIQCPDGEPARIPTEILWCRPCGQGWFLSGGRFLNAE